ncbi:hypothetical protein Tco_1439704 [Tanacetum coccineum]
METKDTLSSCNSEEQQMQQIQDKAKKSCMVSFRKLHSHLKHLSHDNLKGTRIESGFKRAFATLFGQDVETFLGTKIFKGTMFLNMDQLEKQLDKDEFQEIRSMAAFRVLETQYASLVNTKSNGTEFGKQDTSSSSRNDADADDADIRPIYDEESMAKVQLTAECNIFSIGQQHVEQPELNNKGEVDQNAEQCHDTRPLPAKLTDHQTTKLSNQSLESKNISLKEGQHGQFLKVKSNEAKVKHDIDVIETINIELEHKVAKLLKENKTLKKHYKELTDSIKTTRARNIEQTTSLIAKNVEFKDQLHEKGFAIAALKNKLRKLTGNSVIPIIMESLVKKKQKGVILELKRRHLKNTIFCTYTPYPAMKIRRISASSAQEMRNELIPDPRTVLTDEFTMAHQSESETHTTPCPTNPNHAKAKTNGDTKIEISTELIMMVKGRTVADSIAERLTTSNRLQFQDKLQYHSCLNLLFHDWESDLKECEGMNSCNHRVFREILISLVFRTYTIVRNDSSYKYLYEFDESHEALHIFRDIFQKSSRASDI